MIQLDSMSILIVDDMESMRKSIRGMLKMLQIGKTIRLAENGREGWKLINSVPVDLAIIDWNMPIMKGIELLEHIRSSKEYRDMPVIMITAEAEKEIVSEAAESDIDGYLLKPLTSHSLDEKIRGVIDLANEPAKATLHILKARDFEEAGDIKAAIGEVKEALKERPTSSRILRKLGQLYSDMGNDDVAEKCLLKAVAVNSYDAMSRYILGELCLKKNDLAGAVKYYDQAITISPRHISKGVDLGDVLLKKGMGTDAFRIFEKVIKYSGRSLMQTEKVAECCIASGEYGYAKSLIESILKESPDRFDLMFTLATLYERSGDVQSALNYYKTVDESVPDHLTSKLALAKIFFYQKKVFVVDEYLKQILKIDPKNEEALTMRKDNF
ncbi:MAG: response regulator [Proteobacteria bacterium]|nr:response regulator [Pseudomonadota bacterium]